MESNSIWNTNIGYLLYFLFSIVGLFVLCGLGALIIIGIIQLKKYIIKRRERNNNKNANIRLLEVI